MSFYAHQMRNTLTGRAGDWLARHAWPHLTMVAALTLAALGAYQCSLGIVGWGGFALRFSVNFLIGYALFVLYLAIWLWTKSPLDATALLAGAAKSIETKNPWDDEAIEDRQRLIDATVCSNDHQQHQGGAQALIVLAIAAMIVGMLFVAAHLMWNARWYLGRLLVLGGKVRHGALKHIPAASWVTAPLQLTGWAAVILLVHYALLGLLLQWAFPHAATIADLARPLPPQ